MPIGSNNMPVAPWWNVCIPQTDLLFKDKGIVVLAGSYLCCKGFHYRESFPFKCQHFISKQLCGCGERPFEDHKFERQALVHILASPAGFVTNLSLSYIN